MIEMNTIIVGAGVSGQIAKVFFPKSTMIAPTFSNLPSPFFVWNSGYSERFFEMFDFDFSLRQITYNFQSVPNFKEQLKKYNKLTFKKESNIPSNGVESFEAYELDMKPQKPDIVGAVVEIDSKDRTIKLKDGKIMRFDFLFWSAPLINVKIDGVEANSKYSPIGFAAFKSDKKLFDTDYVYLVSPEFLDRNIYRVSQKRTEDEYVYIFEMAQIDKIDPEENIRFLLEKFPSLEFEHACTRLIGHIVEGKKFEDTANVFFVGRFAQMDYEVKTHDVIKKLYKISDCNARRIQ